jgi:hypothetical protein
MAQSPHQLFDDQGVSVNGPVGALQADFARKTIQNNITIMIWPLGNFSANNIHDREFDRSNWKNCQQLKVDENTLLLCLNKYGMLNNHYQYHLILFLPYSHYGNGNMAKWEIAWQNGNMVKLVIAWQYGEMGINHLNSRGENH